jgi:glycosyltransferase involved in cell wall biosynthesis
VSSTPRIAVLVPCLNEEAAIGQVVTDMKQSLPDATVYVYDNGSSDNTVLRARDAGAVVRIEPQKGKGNVVRRMFADVDADVYVMLDGDGTYDAAAAPHMVNLLINEHLDLVTGNRVEDHQSTNTYRAGHRLGNALFTKSVKTIFKSSCEDVLSGYRVMSRRFVKSFPLDAKGFEVEVEMTAHASLLRVPTGEFPTTYRDRVDGSPSKLNTYRDGIRIARALFRIFRSYSPSRFFGSLAGLSGVAAVVSLLLAASEDTDGISAYTVLSGISLVLAALLLSVGVILNALARQRKETLRLTYLNAG